MTASTFIAASADGQAIAIRRGKQLALLDAKGEVVARTELDADDVDLAFVGPPTSLVTLTRFTNTARVTLYQPPSLDVLASVDLPGERPQHIAAVSGPRLAVTAPETREGQRTEGKVIAFVRVAGKTLAPHAIDAGGPIEFAVGLERNQMLMGLVRKLEVWDIQTLRPQLRLSLQLPPAPRMVGAAQGHLWAVRGGGDEVILYRLSDGRPFRHSIGAAIEQVVSHPGSPVIVVVTPEGLGRVQCFAHALAVLETPWKPGTPLAILGSGEDATLIGLPEDSDVPWRIPLGVPAPVPAPIVAPVAPMPPPAPVILKGAKAWREPIAAAATAIGRGEAVDWPSVAADTELGDLAARLPLSANARRTLIALYGTYLVGAKAPSIAQLGELLGDWTEPLGRGDLGALAMLSRDDGRVRLRRAVTDLLDGLPPRTVRFVGDAGAHTPRPGAMRLFQEERGAEFESELAGQLGRIAIIEGKPARAILEARLHGATAVAFGALAARPLPWPRDAGLVVVTEANDPAWLAALPALDL
ncbi:MAG TPA: hypothetical protein VGM88_08025 [Kofleriaceae bacterium]|jgi:hypothetical protein